MEYYRIVRREHAGTPHGFSHYGGRWNPRNVPVIYACSAVSLSMTEFLCIKGSQVLATKWSLITYSIKSNIPLLEKSRLPIDWDSCPYPLATQAFGANWVKTQISACLKIPSARLLLSAYPREHNLLINPFHPDFLENITVKTVEDLHFHLNEWSAGKA